MEAQDSNTIGAYGILNDTGVEPSIIKYLATIYAEILKHRGSPMCYVVKIGITDIRDTGVKRWNDLVDHINIIEFALKEKNLPSLKDKFLI